MVNFSDTNVQIGIIVIIVVIIVGGFIYYKKYSTTQPPTISPATQQPVRSPTQPPTKQPTQPPTKQPTQPPSTQPPSTQPPSTQPPSTQPPSTQPPPIDCEYTWSNWSDCAVAVCGDSYQYRTPIIKRQASNGGKACPSPPNYAMCANNDPSCQGCSVPCNNVNCEWTWGDWGPCSARCGGGTQTRSIKILKPANHWGNPCPVGSYTTETRQCNTSLCAPTGTSGILKNSNSGIIPEGIFQSIVIELWGAGGNGGEGYLTYKNNVIAPGGGGGGAGEYRIIEISYKTSLNGMSYSYTIGDAGSDTTFTIDGNTYIAKAGKNGGNATSTSGGIGGLGGSGGVGGNGIKGNDGKDAPLNKSCGGNGGSTSLGEGGDGCGSKQKWRNGVGRGSGGSGACTGGSGCTPGAFGYGVGGAVQITFK